MSTPILATKLFVPPLRPKIVLRPRLVERLNVGLRQNQVFGRKLTLISAPAEIACYLASQDKRLSVKQFPYGEYERFNYVSLPVNGL